MNARPGHFIIETTALIEREIHEVGRRIEDGGSWTEAGATAVTQR